MYMHIWKNPDKITLIKICCCCNSYDFVFLFGKYNWYSNCH